MKYDVYLAGSLRNPNIPAIHKSINMHTDAVVFSDWFAAGPEADDYWKRYYVDRGFNYRDALRQPASRNAFNFDVNNMNESRLMVLALPAGKSAHLELGWFLGQGKKAFILLEDVDRWDLMYQFATGVTDDIGQLCDWINAELHVNNPDIDYGD